MKIKHVITDKHIQTYGALLALFTMLHNDIWTGVMAGAAAAVMILEVNQKEYVITSFLNRNYNDFTTLFWDSSIVITIIASLISIIFADDKIHYVTIMSVMLIILFYTPVSELSDKYVYNDDYVNMIAHMKNVR